MASRAKVLEDYDAMAWRRRLSLLLLEVRQPPASYQIASIPSELSSLVKASPTASENNATSNGSR